MIVADAHLGQRTGDIGEMRGLLDRAVDAGVREVIFLGDACQYLIGMSKFWSSATRELLSAWDRVRKAGAKIILIEGNRDFFLDEPDLAAHHDGSGLVHQFTEGGRHFRLVHGDRVNQRDLQYRFWRAVSKSRFSRAWARSLPRGLAVRIVNRMEARLSTTNRRFRYRKPIEALQAQAAEAWEEGVDVLFWGHFHTPWRCTSDAKDAFIVPAWLEFQLSLLVDSQGRWSLVENNLTPSSRVLKMDPCPG